MRPYELMFIIDTAKVEGDEAIDAVIERMSRIIAERGGEVLKVDKWGKKRLAYEIDGKMDGFYVILTFEADPPAGAELQRVMRISDEIVRHVLIRKDAVEPPAAEDEEAEAAEALKESAAEPTESVEAPPAQ